MHEKLGNTRALRLQIYKFLPSNADQRQKSRNQVGTSSLYRTVCLQGPLVVDLVGQRVATDVPKYMRMRLEGQLSLDARLLDHAGASGRADWRVALAGEQEG